jgi:hypothetical protein
MASWKKVIVSGSSAELANLKVDDLTTGQVVIGGGSTGDLTTTPINGTGDIVGTTGATNVSLSGSFSGSFQGDGSQLTGVVAASGFSLTQGEGIAPFTYNGGAAATVAVSGAAQLSSNTITKWDDTAGKFVNSSLTDNGTVITGTTSIQLSGASSSLTGSFTGSFSGDGSGLTGLATTLSGSTDSGNFEVDLLTQTLTVQGTANEIETSASGQTITIGLPNNVTIAEDLTVGGDLTVNGDLSYLNVTNLYVEDKFILLNSGSNGPSDGGIVIAQTGNEGKAIAYDSATARWGFTGSLDSDATGIAPDAFIATVIDKNVAESVDVAAYQKPGNIRIETDGEIYIWS